MKKWKPMDAAEDFNDTLYPGVPVWMDQELEAWFRSNFGYDELVALGRAYDTACRNTNMVTNAVHSGYRMLRSAHGDDVVIRFLDYLIHLHGEWAEEDQLDDDHARRVGALAALLERSGSKWKLGMRDGYWGLEERVPEGVQEAADHVIATTGSAGALLSEAWHHAFGVSPNPEEAYEKAIKAVEEAGVPTVLPKDRRATLGKMIQTMRPHGDWTLEITDKQGDHYNELVLSMCDALWNGQPSRHGANGYRKPTQGEAEAAVMLAVPLVQWFHSGAVVRRPQAETMRA